MTTIHNLFLGHASVWVWCFMQAGMGVALVAGHKHVMQCLLGICICSLAQAQNVSTGVAAGSVRRLAGAAPSVADQQELQMQRLPISANMPWLLRELWPLPCPHTATKSSSQPGRWRLLYPHQGFLLAALLRCPTPWLTGMKRKGKVHLLVC